MTVSLTTNQIVYTGNGSTTQWDIPFPFLSADDLKIYVINNGEKTLITSDFEINSTSHVLTYPLRSNGASPLSSQEKLLIIRVTPLSQQTSFSAQETLDPNVLENGYDKAMMIAQDLEGTLKRCVKIPLENINGETDMAVYLNQINQSIATVSNTAGAAQTTANSALSTASSALAQAKSYTDVAVSSLATQTSLSNETSARETADTVLQGNLDNEEEARQQADTLLDESKLDITTAASTYLSQSDASSTYLTQTSAASTYLSQTSASSTYLPQTTAASTYIALSQKAAANGVATLDSTTKIPAAQLPIIDGGNANA